MKVKRGTIQRLFILTVVVVFAACGVNSRAALGMAAPAAQNETLTNDAVLKMVDAKLGDELIVAKIKASHCEFQTSVDEIVKLKGAGVSDEVIQAMVEAGAPPSMASSEAAAPNASDPKSPHDQGIYWLSKAGAAPQMIELEPTVYSAGETSGTLAAVVTYGIHKIAMKAVVRGNRANQRMAENHPEFWFYFDETTTYLGPESFWHGATSPNEFLLARLEMKKDARDLVVGQAGAFGASVGPRSKDTVSFKTEKIASGVYKVTPDEPLAPGEYCFFYGGAGEHGVGKLFDFGVDAAAVAKK